MKGKRILITLLSIAALAAGCKPADNPPKPNESAAAKFELVKKESKEAAHATREYAYAQKAEFVAAMEAEIAQLQKEIDKLSEKIDASTSPAKEEAKAKLQTLREKTVALDGKLDGVKDATESTWEGMKAGVKQGYEETKASFNDVRQWLSDKIAP